MLKQLPKGNTTTN